MDMTVLALIFMLGFVLGMILMATILRPRWFN
jgi:hypothetical protein